MSFRYGWSKERRDQTRPIRRFMTDKVQGRSGQDEERRSRSCSQYQASFSITRNITITIIMYFNIYIFKKRNYCLRLGQGLALDRFIHDMSWINES